MRLPGHLPDLMRLHDAQVGHSKLAVPQCRDTHFLQDRYRAAFHCCYWSAWQLHIREAA